MDSNSCNELPNSKANNLLHQFVLNNWGPSDTSVNALNDEGYSAFHLAVLKNNLLMVKMLLSCLVNIDVNTRCNDYRDENTALHLAAKLGHSSIIQELLNKGAEVNMKNRDGKRLCALQ
ncbi:hypothetical protein AVEN_249748-1 [Araneus ventricosus]|uniref:Alpha-latrotoxin n=1 Tax=Araneus ventricosus TaxID=182803 RepID=A0A4Y2C694_ARAVE|nr:hypothetical protein AVEN_249748-1 [Araneus ventricosus]